MSVTSEDDFNDFSEIGGDEASVSEPNPMEEVKQITEKETRRMMHWKFFVLLSLLATGAAVSSSVYVFLKDKQEDDFEGRFYLHANTIRDTSSIRFERSRDALTELATELTAYAHKSNTSFPFVTMPLFEVNARHARIQSGAEVVGFVPLVEHRDKAAWGEYSVENQWWIEESRGLDLEDDDDDDVKGDIGEEGDENNDQLDLSDQNIPIFHYIYELDENEMPTPVSDDRKRYFPVWQFSPPPFHPFLTNLDTLSVADFKYALDAIIEIGDVIYLRSDPLVALLADTGLNRNEHKKFHEEYVIIEEGVDPFDHPHIPLGVPVFNQLNNAKKSGMAGFIMAILPFDIFVGALLPDGVDGIHAVLRNSCQQTWTYEVLGSKARFLGEGDLHDTSYNHLEVVVPLTRKPVEEETGIGHCNYEFKLYPSKKLEGDTEDNLPLIATVVSAAVFMAIAIAFLVYDSFVAKRNKMIVDAAAKSNAIVLSLFPAHVRDKLLKARDWGNVSKPKKNNGINDLLDTDNSEGGDAFPVAASETIAELFPSASVLFADIAGFTAWSSTREPAQVFQLLEALYSAFDNIAVMRKVFKVETIGDCYVAACGLPTQRTDHAVVLVRFAKDMIYKMGDVLRRLECVLGPGTRDLALRVGIHSGPVTAGVLRGDRARFQLFGDTVNTAARMESNGEKNKIQVSQDTADLLFSHGKQNWLSKREDLVQAKGKGTMQTYWINIYTSVASKSTGSTEVSETTDNDLTEFEMEDAVDVQKKSNLIKWNVEMLARLVRQIIGKREVQDANVEPLSASDIAPADGVPLDELVEVMEFPKNQNASSTNEKDPKLDPRLKRELTSLITNIASLYKANHFHGFEHASHVTMSVVKLLSRVVAPSANDRQAEKQDQHFAAEGILDPLTQFACVFAALIHDIDHQGVSNAQLVKEGASIAEYYRQRSVAEQNSVDLGWQLFVQDDYKNLRQAICPTREDLKRFRQLVVNIVMATDIMDSNLKQLRNTRWEKAFSSASFESSESLQVSKDRKATIIIEHLIQASDVAHTMQHWHVYRKWNECLFMEMTAAYKAGRLAKAPENFWYEGEKGFFDFYIIPLAKKLKDCGVFGVSSDEYLAYAKQNRAEWEVRGQAIVAELKDKAAQNFAAKHTVRDMMVKTMSQASIDL